MCEKCGDTGWVTNWKSNDEYQKIANEKGSLVAGWMQIHDVAFPWKKCICQINQQKEMPL